MQEVIQLTASIRADVKELLTAYEETGSFDEFVAYVRENISHVVMTDDVLRIVWVSLDEAFDAFCPYGDTRDWDVND